MIDRAQVERRHAQDHRRERASQDLGLREARALREVLLRVQPHADAVGDPAAPACALLRRGLRKTDFPTGVKVVVEGYKAKSGAPRANGKTVTFEDGRNFFLGANDADAAAPK